MPLHRTARYAGLIAVAMLVALPAFAQPATTAQSISVTPTCNGCRIELVKVVTLGNPNDPILIQARARPTRDVRGRYYVWGAERGRLIVFDSLGRYMQAIGRQGQGPGEFVASAGEVVAAPGDSLRVILMRRLQVFAPDYRYVRGAPMAGGSYGNALMLHDGTMVYASPVRRDTSWEPPMHIISPDGTLIRSFGATPSVTRENCSTCPSRLLAPSAVAGRIWAARVHTYRIEEWTTVGVLTRAFVVDDSRWFPRDIAEKLQAGEIRTNRTTPGLHGIWQDAAGMLWVVGGASRSGKVVEAPPRRGIGVVPQDSATLAATPRRIVIDVIDPGTRSILTTRSLDEEFYGVLGNGLLYSHRSDADGFAYVDIWRATLRKP